MCAMGSYAANELHPFFAFQRDAMEHFIGLARAESTRRFPAAHQTSSSEDYGACNMLSHC